jgi:sugar/nucleoside kinase (ribokinase family)
MSFSFDVAAVGNAIVDVISSATDAFLVEEGLAKGAMTLIDTDQADALYARMGAGIEASGGSAGNTVAGVASLGGRAAYIGKVAGDVLGGVFRHDITAIGVHFEPKVSESLGSDGLRLGTGRCLINVTPDGQRTMSTYLGAANTLSPEDVTPEIVQAALAKAWRRIALTLSDGFVVERHREDLLAFIASDVDIVFANEAEVTALFQTADYDTAVAALAHRVDLAAVTKGEHGSVLVSRTDRAAVPAAPIAKVVDTTGAGDQYAAGVLYGLARGLDLAICGRLGSLAAAEVIGHFGPRPQTPLKALAQSAGLI